MRHWDWDGMVEANRGWLIRLLAGLSVVLGSGDRVQRRIWREVLASLLPMESALRRLIYVMARDLSVVIASARACPKNIPKGGSGAGKPVFALTDNPRIPDPQPRSGKGPGIRWLDDWMPTEPEKPEPSDDDLIDISALRRRLAAMEAALADLPRQAKRLARWYARNARQREGGKWRRFDPIRSGRPPGNREDGKGEVDDLLATCHDLAVRCQKMLEKERYG